MPDNVKVGLRLQQDPHGDRARDTTTFTIDVRRDREGVYLATVRDQNNKEVFNSFETTGLLKAYDELFDRSAYWLQTIVDDLRRRQQQ